MRVETVDWTIAPANGVRGTLQMPGDKSISHRLAMLCGLAGGASTISGFLDSEDCLHTLGAMNSLGVEIERKGQDVWIKGTANGLRRPGADLDLGNSGTGIRLLSGLLAGQPFVTTMTGDASLCSRPMGRIADPLRQMGARVELLGEHPGCAPIRIHGGALHAIHYRLPMASAQVKSCVLLAGLGCDDSTVVVEPKPTRDHTERLLAAMGAQLEVDGLTVSMQGGGAQRLTGGDWTVPGDFSSAAFWLGAAAIFPGSDIRIEGVGLNPRRTALIGVLRRMGCEIEVHEVASTWEPRGRLTIRGGPLRGTVVSGEEIPNLIDELPLIATLGACAEGATRIRDAEELRLKESDRIGVMASNLESLGVRVETRPDGMTVYGGGTIEGGTRVESHGDHRVAMCMAILGLKTAHPLTVGNVACVGTSYPGFLADLEKVRMDGE